MEITSQLLFPLTGAYIFGQDLELHTPSTRVRRTVAKHMTC